MTDASCVIREHAAFVWRVLRHLGVPDDQLEDVSQEVFIVVCRRLCAFEQRSSLRTWLYGICRNLAMDWRRRQRRRPEQPQDLLPDTPQAEVQSRDLCRRDVQQLLRAALNGLPEANRLVFVLYEIEQMDMEQVAESVGCNASTAYSRLYAARKQLRTALIAAGCIDVESVLAEVS
jgi:RNA polymerase sigma-70 factor, ECF subfamily